MTLFVYHGKDEIIIEEVSKHGATLDSRYRAILGEERYTRLEEASARLISSDCFFEDPKEVRKKLDPNFPINSLSSKLLLVTDADNGLFANGRIKKNNARLGVAFYVSSESFEHSGSAGFTDNPLATYVHEFNHFASLALQRVPIFIAQSFMCADSGSMKSPVDVANYSAKLSLDGKLRTAEKRQKIQMAMAAQALDDFLERANGIFDRLVLESIGIEKPLPWRGKEREYAPIIMHDPYAVLAVPIDGDPFSGVSDMRVVENFFNWEENLVKQTIDPYVLGFYDSLAEYRVEVMPITELYSQARGEENRRVGKGKKTTKRRDSKKDIRKRRKRR